MTHVVGVDPSLVSTGLVWNEPGAGGARGWDVEHRYRPKTKTDPQRMIEIRDFVLEQCVDPNPLVVIEGFSYGSKGRAVFQVAGLGWLLRAAFHEQKIPYIDVPPPTLKKFATGKGNAGKDLVVSEVTHRAGRVFDSNDVVDAVVLYSIGRHLVGLDHPLGNLPKTHLSALDSLDVVAHIDSGR